MTSDLDLLWQFARENSQDAFTEIVRRHLNLVYSAALRQVRSPQLAEEISQSVFADLARNAGKLNSETILTAWLYAVTRRTAIDVIRKESRRQLREQIAVEMNDMNATANDWTQIEPLLDDAMAALDETDRAAILLRYFENKNLREVGASLKISDDTAQKRVSRAVERLREFFSKRKITVGASGLVVLISANAVQSAPIGLAATISAAAVLTGTAVHISTVIAATKTIAMTTLQKSIIGAAFAVAVGAGIFEAHQASQLRAQNELLAQQIAQLQTDNESLSNRIADIGEAKKLADDQFNELLKLRGEIGVLQNEANDPLEKAAKAAVAKAKFLKQYLEQHPDRKIPELQFLSEKDWADAAWSADLNTDDGIRVALSNLRGEAENIFLNQMMQTAIKKYLAINNNILPANLSELKSYFDVPVTDEMLQRYTLLQSGTPNDSADLVKLTSFADDDYDSTHVITLYGASGGGFNRNEDAINDAAREFARANNYQAPTDPTQIAPYLHKTIDPATIQKYLNQFVVDPPSSDMAILAPVLSAYSNAHNGAHPGKVSDLIPYITTPEQKAVLQRLEPNK
jgi:RNA polymerase sigma factor (sigma-70 family)